MDEKHDSGDSAAYNGHEENGVDVTLIRWMLSLWPRQRLDVLQNHVNSVLRLRESIRPSS